MTIQNIPGGITWPTMLPLSKSFLQYAAFDPNGGQYAYNFRIPKTGTISKVSFLYRSSTLPTTPYVVGLQSVGANGWPSGAYLANGNAKMTWTAPLGTMWTELPLNSPTVVSQGDLVSLVITSPVSGAGNVAIGFLQMWDGAGIIGMPTLYAFRNGGWSLPPSITGYSMGMCAINYLDGTVGDIPYVFPFTSSTRTNLQSGLYQIGVKFSVPFAASVCGAVFEKEDFTGTTGNTEIVLYDSTGVYANALAKTNVLSGGDNAQNIYFPNDVILHPNVQYRLVMRAASSVVPNISVYGLPSSNYLSNRSNFIYTSSAISQPTGLSTDWSDDPTSTVLMALLINGIDDDTGTTGYPQISPISIFIQ